jgi:hypothetical protein
MHAAMKEFTNIYRRCEEDLKRSVIMPGKTRKIVNKVRKNLQAFYREMKKVEVRRLK